MTGRRRSRRCGSRSTGTVGSTVLPGELPGAPLAGEQRRQALGQRLEVANGFELGELRLLLGAVLEAVEVERLDALLAVGALDPAIEPAAALLAQQVLLEHACRSARGGGTSRATRRRGSR